DGFGGYRKKAASSHPGRKLAASNVQVNGRFRPSNQLSLFAWAGGFDAPGVAVKAGLSAIGAKGEMAGFLRVTCRREVKTPDVVGNLLQGSAVRAAGCPGDVRGKLR